jgi:hypothetical protein
MTHTFKVITVRLKISFDCKTISVLFVLLKVTTGLGFSPDCSCGRCAAVEALVVTVGAPSEPAVVLWKKKNEANVQSENFSQKRSAQKLKFQSEKPRQEGISSQKNSVSGNIFSRNSPVRRYYGAKTNPARRNILSEKGPFFTSPLPLPPPGALMTMDRPKSVILISEFGSYI